MWPTDVENWLSLKSERLPGLALSSVRRYGLGSPCAPSWLCGEPAGGPTLLIGNPAPSPGLPAGWRQAVPGAYLPSRIKSATRSASMMMVALVLARTMSGIAAASTTRSPSIPCTLQRWSTTASGSDAGPILQVTEV